MVCFPIIVICGQYENIVEYEFVTVGKNKNIIFLFHSWFHSMAWFLSTCQLSLEEKVTTKQYNVFLINHFYFMIKYFYFGESGHNWWLWKW